MTNKNQLLIRVTDPAERKRLTEEYARFEYEVIPKDDEYVVVRKARPNKKERSGKSDKERDSRNSGGSGHNGNGKKSYRNTKRVRTDARNTERPSDED